MTVQSYWFRLFVPLFILAPALATAGEATGEWHTAMTDASASSAAAVTLLQSSLTTIKDASFKNDVTPVLEFRCTPGDPAIIARIDWQRFISSFSTEAGFKVDGGRFTWRKWKVDQTEAVTISPSAGDSQTLLELLVAGSELLVEISPYSEGPVTAQFNLSGLSTEIDALRNKCE